MKQSACLVAYRLAFNEMNSVCRLEQEVWTALFDIAEREGISIHELARLVSIRKSETVRLDTALRVFSIAYFRISTERRDTMLPGYARDYALLDRIFERA